MTDESKLQLVRAALVATHPEDWDPTTSHDDCAVLLAAFRDSATRAQIVDLTVELIRAAEEISRPGYLLNALLLPPGTVCECMARALGIEVQS